MPTTCKFGKLISAERQCGLVECVRSQKDGSRAQTVTSLFDVTEPGVGFQWLLALLPVVIFGEAANA